ncbi:MAG TPA: cytochrome c oxidase assembly protein [Burkholderiales bacterium]|nr:cytochrome c oxidase assembly protein [Burkholderiales bacterium]
MRKLGLSVALAAPALVLFCAAPAYAHPDAPHSDAGAEPWLALLLIVAAVLYALGLHHLQDAGGARRASVSRSAVSFWLGWTALAAALVWPLPEATEGLFSAHMMQHELLMVIGAPLMVLARPLAIWTWALPAHWRKSVARPFHGAGFQHGWQWVSAPAAASVLHALAIWLWHVPKFFELAEESLAVHALQHTAFLGSALLFWWAVLRPTRSGNGAALACLFVTMLHTSALGVLLTFSSDVWYPGSTAGAYRWGLTPLEDQQLGGLVMWVPGGIPYVIAALLCAAQWLTAGSRSGRSDVHSGTGIAPSEAFDTAPGKAVP